MMKLDNNPKFAAWLTSQPAEVQSDLGTYYDAQAADLASNHHSSRYAVWRAVMSYAQATYGYDFS